MKYISLILLLLIPGMILSQEKLEVQGAIIIGQSEDPSPVPGTIRWTGSDFEGWTGEEWLSLSKTNYVTDIDGNNYPTVNIGNQRWMGENLRTTRLNDGTAIPYVYDDVDYPAYSWYNEDADSIGAIYGAFYTWYAVETGKLCPLGWEVPSNADYFELMNYLGGDVVAGGKLKESGIIHWNAPNTGGSNASKFNALPAGWRNGTGSGGLGTGAGWWTSIESGASANEFGLNHNTAFFAFGIDGKPNGRSVRCIQSNGN